jgi:hypothetical protein
MQTDLFRALLDSRNARDHPILNAMVYEFCPAAAHWWLSGVDPVLPYDMVWKMMEMRATGINLREALESFSLVGLAANVANYITSVDSYRFHLKEKVASPELHPGFEPEKNAKFPDRFGYADGFAKLGGKRGWLDVLEFARLWSFVFVDWQLNSHIKVAPNETEVEFELVTLSFIHSGIRKPALFPAWLWRVKTRMVTRNVIGLPVDNINDQPQLKFALVSRASNADDKHSWENDPEIYALDRRTGESNPYNPTIRVIDALAMITPLSKMAKNGPYPPTNALAHPQTCQNCGFMDQCYRKGVLSEFAINSMEIGL